MKRGNNREDVFPTRREPTASERESAERAWRKRIAAEVRARIEQAEVAAVLLEREAEELVRQACGPNVALFPAQTVEQLKVLLRRLRAREDIEPSWFAQHGLDPAFGQLRPDGSRVFDRPPRMPDEFLDEHVRAMRRAAIRAKFKWLRTRPIPNAHKRERPKLKRKRGSVKRRPVTRRVSS